MKEKKTELTFTIFMLIKTTPTWLQLAHKERFAFLNNTIKPILTDHLEVSMRFFDAEAYSEVASDVIVWETQNLWCYQSVVENLRESNFWSAYFDVVYIIPSIENAYAGHYDVTAY